MILTLPDSRNPKGRRCHPERSEGSTFLILLLADVSLGTGYARDLLRGTYERPEQIPRRGAPRNDRIGRFCLLGGWLAPICDLTEPR